MRKALSVVALTLTLAGISGPAIASDGPSPGATPHPTVGWPMPRAAGDTGPLDVVIVGHRDVHGLRAVARYIDARVVGLRIHTRPGLECTDVPHLSMCIRARVGDFGNTGWAGWAPTDPALTSHTRTVWLNTHYPYRGCKVSIAGHELMHALGMEHHLERGIVGVGWPDRPSPHEIQALEAAY